MEYELPSQRPTPENEQPQEQAAEAPPARQEQVGKQPPQAVTLPALPDDIPAVDQPVIAAPPQDVTTASPTDPKGAIQDSDRIERVWVDKVKSVVARTRNDPHAQEAQMSKVKADYIQKRFNKTIKTDEAKA